MHRFFIAILLIFIITINASEILGNKIVLASFKTFNEAKKHLNTFGAQLTHDEIELQKTYHFEIVARRSGEVFIVALEPFKDEKSAKTVADHFKKNYPDVLVNNYFGPTEGAIVWHKQEILPQISEDVVLAEENRENTPALQEESTGYLWPIILGISGIFMAGWFWIIRRKKGTNVTHTNQYEKIKSQFFSANGWKYHEALHRAGGNKEYLKMMIQNFLIDAPKLLNDLKEGLRKGDFPEMQLRAHTLKGLAATIASSTLRISAQRLEHSIRERNRDFIEDHLVECETILEKIITLLQDSPMHEEEYIHNINNDPSIFVSLLQELRENLNKCIFVDVTRLKLFDIAVDVKRAPLMAELKICVERLEHAKALELIEEIEKIDQ